MAASRFALDVAVVAQHELGVRADDHQQIVEVVRDAAGEAAHDLELLRVLQLRFERGALRDVA